jgi:hypothetical protein
MKTEVPKHSRPARTPPSTFLFLHLHLSNSPGPKPPPATAGTSKFHSTTNDNRLQIGCSSTHHRRSFTRHENLPWPRAKAAPRSVGRVIGPPDPPCQRFVVNKSSHRAVFLRREAAALSGEPLASHGGATPYLSHNPATF